jgi:hypothetical protein
LGRDGTLRQGMGAAVIGGLMLSTLLSLVFVPAMFVLDRSLGTLGARLPAEEHRPTAHEDPETARTPQLSNQRERPRALTGQMSISVPSRTTW